MGMAGIQLTLVLGHPLAITPAIQATVPDATSNSPVWIVGLRSTDSPQSPGPQTPPVIS